MGHQKGPKHTFDGISLPNAGVAQVCSWCKAPRLDVRVIEVGSLARQQVDGHSLIRQLVDHSGRNVRNRLIARLLQTARVLLLMEAWVRAIRPRETFCHQAPIPQEAQGFGLVEAARGSLGYWVRVEHGRILNYQIIAPTTWNFSPRDRHGQPRYTSGPLGKFGNTQSPATGSRQGALHRQWRAFSKKCNAELAQ
jgi:hydrogenase large subunit